MILLGFQCLRPDARKSHPFAQALSLCDDYCDHLPDTWCLDWTTSRAVPGDFTPDEATRIISECTGAFGSAWEWPDLMVEGKWARSFYQRWAKTRGYRLVAIACAESDRLLLEEATRPPAPQEGFSPVGALGIHLMATRAQKIDDNWPILGWEVLDANSGIIGDCHTDSAVADAVTGLMPDYETATELVRDLDSRPDRPSWAHPIPIALVAVLHEVES